MDETPELAQAAKVTLERRLTHGGGHTGWSRAWIINHYAKLWDGEQAYFYLQKILEKSTLKNLFALPSKWKEGSVSGLCLVGGAEISLQWSGHELTSFTITAKQNWDSVVIYKEWKKKVNLKAGESFFYEYKYNY